MGACFGVWTVLACQECGTRVAGHHGGRRRGPVGNIPVEVLRTRSRLMSNWLRIALATIGLSMLFSCASLFNLEIFGMSLLISFPRTTGTISRLLIKSRWQTTRPLIPTFMRTAIRGTSFTFFTMRKSYLTQTQKASSLPIRSSKLVHPASPPLTLTPKPPTPISFCVLCSPPRTLRPPPTAERHSWRSLADSSWKGVR